MLKYKNSKFLIGTILFIFILNIFIKSIGITTNCISLDEPFSIFYSQMSVKDIVNELIKGNNPPLWEIILHFWIKIFGSGKFSVRFLPMLFSSFTAIYIFLIGKRFFNYKTGLTAALLFSFSNYHLFFSHEARIYPLFCLLTTMSMYHFLTFLKYPKQQIHLIAFTLCNIVVCYAHYFGFFLLFTQLLCTLFYLKLDRRIVYSYILSLFIFLIAYLPIVKVYISRLFVSVNQGTWLSSVKGDSWFFLLASWTNNRINLIIFLIFVVVSLIFLMRKLTRNYESNIFSTIVFSWFWIPFLLMYFISFRVPMFLDRYLIYISPAFYLIIPLSLRFLPLNSRLQKITLVIFISLMLISFKFNISNHRDIDRIAEKVKEIKANTNAEIYLCPPWTDLNFMYYYDNNLFSKPYSFAQSLNKNGIFPIYNFEGLRNETLTKKKSLIYIDFNSTFVFPENTILNVLRKNYAKCDSFPFLSGFKVYHFKNIE